MVLGKQVRGPTTVAIGERGDDGAVLSQGSLVVGAHSVRRMPCLTRTMDYGVRQGPKWLVGAVGSEPDMKLGVDLGSVIGPAAGDRCGLSLDERSEVRSHGNGIARTASECLRLDGSAQLDKVTQRGLVAPQPVVDEPAALPFVGWIRDEGPPSRAGFDIAEGPQASETFPQHGPRHTKLIGQVPFGRQALAGTEMAGIDPLADLGRSRIGQIPARPLHSREGRCADLASTHYPDRPVRHVSSDSSSRGSPCMLAPAGPPTPVLGRARRLRPEHGSPTCLDTRVVRHRLVRPVPWRELRSRFLLCRWVRGTVGAARLNTLGRAGGRTQGRHLGQLGGSLGRRAGGAASLSNEDEGGMEYFDFLPLDRQLSRLSLGTGNIPWQEPEHAFALLDHWFALGGTVIDTAHYYEGGNSEKVIGQWLRRTPTEGAVIVTKVGHPTNWTKPRLRPDQIRDDLTVSLGRLGVDAVDVLLLHRDDPDEAVGPILETLNEELSASRIRSFGASNWTIGRLTDAAEYAEAHGLIGFTSSSPQLSLASPIGPLWPGCVSADDQQSLAWYAQTSMLVMAWSPAARGYFGNGAVAAFGAEPSASDAFQSADNEERRRRAQELARARGGTAHEVALAWVLHQPFPVMPVIGALTPAEQDSCCRALRLRLSREEVTWLSNARTSPV